MSWGRPSRCTRIRQWIQIMIHESQCLDSRIRFDPGAGASARESQSAAPGGHHGRDETAGAPVPAQPVGHCPAGLAVQASVEHLETELRDLRGEFGEHTLHPGPTRETFAGGDRPGAGSTRPAPSSSSTKRRRRRRSMFNARFRDTVISQVERRASDRRGDPPGGRRPRSRPPGGDPPGRPPADPIGRETPGSEACRSRRSDPTPRRALGEYRRSGSAIPDRLGACCTNPRPYPRGFQTLAQAIRVAVHVGGDFRVYHLRSASEAKPGAP